MGGKYYKDRVIDPGMQRLGRCRLCHAKMPTDDLVDHVSSHAEYEMSASLVVSYDLDEEFDVLAVARMPHKVPMDTVKKRLHALFSRAFYGEMQGEAGLFAPAAGLAAGGLRLRVHFVEGRGQEPRRAAESASIRVLAFGISDGMAGRLGPHC